MLRSASLSTARLVIRPWQRSDLEDYQAWPSFGEPLLDALRYPQRTPTENDLYWAMSQLASQTAHWTIIWTDRIVGTIDLGRIDQVRGSGQLGIVLGAPFVGQGIGSEALRGWLPAYFGAWGFQSITLEVAGWNRRALQVYRRLGFTVAESYWEAVGAAEDYHFLQLPHYDPVRHLFRWGNDGVYAAYSSMVLDRQTWLAAGRSPFA